MQNNCGKLASDRRQRINICTRGKLKGKMKRSIFFNISGGKREFQQQDKKCILREA
jgi:hypothetical protein